VSVDTEWSKDHVSPTCAYTLIFWILMLDKKWRPGGAHVEIRHLQGCSPHLCRLRTEGWYPRASIECTDRMLVFMGPVNQCSLLSTDVWLKPTASMAVGGEKLGGCDRNTSGSGSSTRISLSDSRRSENTINTHKYNTLY
jgi:hypothetical protein